MSKSKLGWLAIILAFTITFGAGCQDKRASKKSTARVRPVGGASEVELKVWAAASLKDALEELAGSFEDRENAKVVFNFAASGDLQVQIEQGAPADVFISAGVKQMDALEKRGLVDRASRRNLVGNTLVLVEAESSRLPVAKIEDLIAVDRTRKIAMGNPDEVPAGKYAREALEKAGIFDAIRPQLVWAKDVRQVLGYVETGNVDAGFVYLTDAKISKKVKIALRVPSSYHKPIVYPAAVVLSGKQRELATRFADFLKGEEATSVFEKYGFSTGKK